MAAREACDQRSRRPEVASRRQPQAVAHPRVNGLIDQLRRQAEDALGFRLTEDVWYAILDNEENVSGFLLNIILASHHRDARVRGSETTPNIAANADRDKF